MNSSTNSVARPRLFSLRRMVWAAVCIVSLTVLYYQWENWRSARELKALRQRIVERLGTDDPFAFVPSKVPDDQNYFANATIESWKRERKPGRGGVVYQPPKDALLPAGFVMPEIKQGIDGGADTLDLQGWMVKRAHSGKPVPPEQSAEAVLAHELGDGNGLISKLAVGLNRPYSVMKPGRREALEASEGNPWNAQLPQFERINEFQRQLGLHLRSAARMGDQTKTVDCALIMLRFAEAPTGHGMLGCLVPLALHELVMDALHEALALDAWNPTSLSRLQLRLSQFDDLKNEEQSRANEVLGMLQTLAYFRSHRTGLRSSMSSGNSGGSPFWEHPLEEAFYFLMIHGPIGWHDANIAFYADCMLDQMGSASPQAWLTAGERDALAIRRSKEANSWPNPRRILGALAIPNLGNISSASAGALFHRRCLIIACALEKHRLEHGSFPASLEAVRGDLKPFDINDPARPTQLPGYRLEKEGYLLWSAGPDARDDGGETVKDWLWRMKLEH